MKINKLFLLVIFSFICSHCLAQDKPHWRLVWSDEFNNDAIDWRVWSKVPRGTPEWKRHASNYDSLYAVEDGCLVLRAMRNDVFPEDSLTCLTGDVWSLNKKAFGFGRIEVRAKLDCASGFWPAIWMLPQSARRIWPDDGEIDIMEHLNYDSLIHQTVHSAYTVKLGVRNNPVSGRVFPYNPDEFNVYAVERYPDSLVFFINDKRTFSYPRIKTDKKNQFPFSESPFYMILSAQLGGSWVGTIDLDRLPVEMKVDYVRFYVKDAPPIIPFPKEFAYVGEGVSRIRKIKVLEPTSSILPCPQNPEEYYLRIDKGHVAISGNELLARQTLKQLTNASGKVPNVMIHDWPSYPFRGFMHDTGRNFQTIDMLKRTLDLMSFYKLNYFQWHLTDHPAWRIQCKAFPQLNDPKYQRQGRDEGKFYTYDEIRELFAYAQERGITIVPEIDMPGHSTYFNSCFGFGMDSEGGKKILEACLNEFFTEIPADICPYFHIGSDEIHISDPEGFMRWVEAIVAKNHRKAIAWDPGLPSDDNTIRQIWNEAAGSNAAAAEKPGKYLDSFVGYLNYYDPIFFTNKVFMHEAAAQPVPDTTKSLGGILCLWNDVRVDDKENIALHNGMVNGMMAFSERFWNGGEGGSREILASFEENMAYHRDRFLSNENVRWVANSMINWKIKVGGDEYVSWGGAIDMDDFCRKHNVKVSDTMDAQALTTIIATSDTVIRAWVGFEAPARSNRISGGIGQQGEWENRGRLFVNGKEIFPPRPWAEAGKYAYPFHTWMKAQEEEPYTDEQLYWMREPVFIPLKKGVNHVELSIPKTFAGQRWSFAFIPLTIDADGRVSEAKGIQFVE